MYFNKFEEFYVLMSEGLICTLANKMLGYTEGYWSCTVWKILKALYNMNDYFNYNAAFKNRAAMAGTGFK